MGVFINTNLFVFEVPDLHRTVFPLSGVHGYRTNTGYLIVDQLRYINDEILLFHCNAK